MRELSTNQTWMIVRAPRDIGLVADPATTLGGPPGEGKFSVSEDRRVGGKYGTFCSLTVIVAIRSLSR